MSNKLNDPLGKYKKGSPPPSNNKNPFKPGTPEWNKWNSLNKKDEPKKKEKKETPKFTGSTGQKISKKNADIKKDVKEVTGRTSKRRAAKRVNKHATHVPLHDLNLKELFNL